MCGVGDRRVLYLEGVCGVGDRRLLYLEGVCGAEQEFSLDLLDPQAVLCVQLQGFTLQARQLQLDPLCNSTLSLRTHTGTFSLPHSSKHLAVLFNI